MAPSSVPGTAGPGRLATAPSASSGPEVAEGAELTELRAQLREARDTLEAIRGGGVDSLMIGPPGHEQVYAVASADRTYRLIVQAMNEGTATVSPRGVILDANPRLGSMTGRTAMELTGTPVLDLFPDLLRTTAAGLLDVGVGERARGEAELTGPGGTAIPVLLAVSAFDLDGVLLRCLVLTDLSAQRRAESEVRELNAQLEARVEQRTAELERANHNLEAFSYSVSHDLRAPLRALSGFSEALLEEYGGRLDDTGRGYAERVQAASERMGNLIDDLLLLSRVSRGDLHRQPVDLSQDAHAIVDDLQFTEPGRRVRFVIQDDVRVTADPALLRSVVQNLIGNAWKFTAPRHDAVIEFAATTTDAEIRCSVRDNGAGFDPAYVGQLFQPFQRLHLASDFAGNGIGLASVRRIIERHGGRAWAEGAPDQGAVFYFTLPRA